MNEKISAFIYLWKKEEHKMTENKRFLIDDAGELIDLNNHKFIDYGDECCKLLNELHDEIQLLHKINESTINFMYDNFDSNIIFTDRELNDICNEMGWELSEKGIKIKQLEEENEQLKQQLKSIEDSFKFSCTENHIEFNKDKLKVKDTHTELTLKDGKLCISLFIPQLN